MESTEWRVDDKLDNFSAMVTAHPSFLLPKGTGMTGEQLRAMLCKRGSSGALSSEAYRRVGSGDDLPTIRLSTHNSPLSLTAARAVSRPEELDTGLDTVLATGLG